jgi:hypothetical protein
MVEEIVIVDIKKINPARDWLNGERPYVLEKKITSVKNKMSIKIVDVKYVYVKLKIFLLDYILSEESCNCLKIVLTLIHLSPKCFAG